ncbi:hypothetical protein AA0120_g8920 [Alternaria tenuissima]|nr:hypothetical protein AA0120_g8920 [Alternaria tenuissima]
MPQPYTSDDSENDSSDSEEVQELSEQEDDTDDWEDKVVTHEGVGYHCHERKEGLFQPQGAVEEEEELDEEQAAADAETFERFGARGVVAQDEELAQGPYGRSDEDEDDGFGGFVEDEDEDDEDDDEDDN